MSILAYKYRIYPNKIQREALDNILFFLKDLYNSALEERITAYKKLNKSINYFDQQRSIKGMKDVLGFAENIHSQSSQAVLKQVDNSFQNFFRKVKKKDKSPGFPRYKTRYSFRSILFTQCNLKTGGVKRLSGVKDNKVIVKGVPGEIKVKFHRLNEGNIKTVRIKKYPDGEYYLVLSCDDIPKKPLQKTGKTIGIDFGISTFITMDDGTPFHNPTPYKTSKEKLAYMQKKREGKKKGSNNSRKLKLKIAKEHQYISNVREDFQHKLANDLIKEYDQIYIEDLNIKSMLEAKGFEVKKSNISDASIGRFVHKLIYKAERADKPEPIKVNPKNTSKTCSCCKYINKHLKLSDRIFKCEKCDFELDRDQNAAINIKVLGMSLATGQKPVSEASPFRER